MYLNFLKLNRLLIPSAWKNLKWGDTVSFIICLIGSIILISLSETVKDWIFICSGQVICIVSLAFIIFRILYDVCWPFKIVKLSNGRIKVGVYKSQTLHKHDLFELIIHKENREICVYASEYDFPFKNPAATCFTFRSASDSPNWLVWDTQTLEGIILGRRLNKILFISPKENLTLKVLQENGNVSEIVSDYMVYDECCIPKGSSFAFADRRANPQIPDKFLFVCQKDVYKSYGFYLREDEPKCKEILLSSVILREGKDRIILQYEEDKAQYQEIYRCLDPSHRLNEYFIEFTNDYRVGGNIYRYDGKQEKLEKIYEGNFRSIDFNNGQILGDDGKIYGRDNNK